MVGARGILRRSEQAAERAAAATIGIVMFGAVFLLETSWTRRIVAAGAVLFLWLALRPRRRPPVPSAIPLLDAEPGPDAELLAIVHARLAEQDEKVCGRLDRLIAELQER
jgi:hypothetical protein